MEVSSWYKALLLASVLDTVQEFKEVTEDAVTQSE